MKQQGGWRWVRRLAGVALPLLAGVLLAPATAHASCGDYVLLGDGHPPPAGVKAPQAPSAPLSQPRSCSGPLCSRHTPPPLPPGSTVPVPVEDRCCPPAPLVLGDCQAVARLLEPSCPKPAHGSVAVYHPPRPFAV
jgi:hypothetical protein